MIVKIGSHKRAATKFYFDNGNEVSMIWGWGSYTENHSKYEMMGFPGEDAMRKSYENRGGVIEIGDQVSSSTVEIMVDGTSEFVEWFTYAYENNPKGNIPVSQIPLIIAQADRLG